MKALFFSLLFLSFIQKSNGQIPFAPLGAKYLTYASCPPTYEPSFNFTTISLDTVIQGKYCTGVGEFDHLISSYFFNCSWTSKFVHADSQQVFVYDDINQEFNLVYDFSKQAGDSYRIKMCEYLLGTDSATVNVVSIENIMYDTIPAIKQVLEVVGDSGAWFGDVEYEIYEGIGGERGNVLLFHQGFGTTSHCSTGTSCYWSEITGAVGIAGSHVNCIPTDSEETIEVDYFKVYPNPSYGNVNLEYDLPPDLKNVTISLFNSRGQLHTTIQLNGASRIREINHLPVGIYFMTMVAEGKVIGSDKLVVIN